MDGHHDHGHGPGADAARSRLLLVALLNGGFVAAEVAGGIAFGSLALLADAAHMASDAGGLVLALVAQTLVLRPPSGRHTYGLGRSEVLAAQANGLLTGAAGLWVIVEAVRRLGDAPATEGLGVTLVALAGLAVNLISVYLLFGLRHHNLNMRGAFLHMASDTAGSVAATVAGVSALVGSAYWVDPLASIVIGVLVVWSAWGLLRATTHVLLEGAPAHLDRDRVAAAVLEVPPVVDVHHLHLWFLDSSSVALSAHVVLDGEPTLHEAQVVGDRIRHLLHERFGIEHATLELECHRCEPTAGAADVMHRVGPA